MAQLTFDFMWLVAFLTVYADASSVCNMLNFQLGSIGIGTTIPTRQWNIKVTQIQDTSYRHWLRPDFEVWFVAKKKLALNINIIKLCLILTILSGREMQTFLATLQHLLSLAPFNWVGILQYFIFVRNNKKY